MKKKRAVTSLVTICIIIVFISLGIYYFLSYQEPLAYIKDQSWHDAYKILDQDKEVIFFENIHVRNRSNKEIKFEIFANYSEDIKSGLLSEAYIKGLNLQEENKTIFELGPQSNNTFEVIFVGKLGTAKHKQNRLPPKKIKFQIIESN